MQFVVITRRDVFCHAVTIQMSHFFTKFIGQRAKEFYIYILYVKIAVELRIDEGILVWTGASFVRPVAQIVALLRFARQPHPEAPRSRSTCRGLRKRPGPENQEFQR